MKMNESSDWFWQLESYGYRKSLRRFCQECNMGHCSRQFKGYLSSTQATCCRMGAWLWIINWNGCQSTWSWPVLRKSWRTPGNTDKNWDWQPGFSIRTNASYRKERILYPLNLCTKSVAPESSGKSKAVPLHAMDALGGRGSIAPTHSRPRH
jgi:hypothetical protein